MKQVIEDARMAVRDTANGSYGQVTAIGGVARFCTNDKLPPWDLGRYTMEVEGMAQIIGNSEVAIGGKIKGDEEVWLWLLRVGHWATSGDVATGVVLTITEDELWSFRMNPEDPNVTNSMRTRWFDRVVTSHEDFT